MRKFISVALSAVMLVSAGAIYTMPAMAATVSQSETTTKKASDTVKPTVNTKPTDDVQYNFKGKDYEFKYNGGGKVVGWNFAGMIEGKDYIVISQSNNNRKIKIQLTESGLQKEVDANATVKPTETVNGIENAADVNRKNTNNGRVTYTYTGKAKAKDWTFPGMEEGKDYKVVSTSKDGKKITIQLLNGKSADEITANINTKASLQVNGKEAPSKFNKKTSADNKKVIAYTYKGKGTVTGWKLPGMKKGVDYKILSQKGNTIKIKLLGNRTSKDVVINAIVKGASKKDNGSKSPATGASMAGFAVAGAGVAMLTALKKKD